MIYQYLGEKKEGGKKKKQKKKEPKATVTATFPLSEPFVSGFSWKRCLSKQLLSCTAASPPGMHGEHGSWRDHNNPCGLGCHGRHNGELCGGTAGAKHDSPPAQPAPDTTTAISQLQWTNTHSAQQPQPPRSLTHIHDSRSPLQSNAASEETKQS